ncbi:DUF2878 family protein [Desulfotalea psychrophila]|uniref:DUF2878 family protein n=1 Tax=Desulfotalea psychrophila TaxID=84980 RepID=UPI0002E3EB86
MNSGACVGVLLLLIHLFFVKVRSLDLRMLGFLLVAGLVVDGSLHHIGFISFTTTGLLIPL